MDKNTYEKSLVHYDNSIFGRIKLFFTNLFKTNIQKTSTNSAILSEQNCNSAIKNRFLNEIKIPEKKVNLRLQKMQKDLENGIIIEEDLCEQELEELRELYLEQIEIKKQSIENYKNRILRIKHQLV